MVHGRAAPRGREPAAVAPRRPPALRDAPGAQLLGRRDGDGRT